MRKYFLILFAVLWAHSALAQSYGPQQPAIMQYINLYNTGTIVGNGADLTEDTLQTYVVPANTLLNAGDRIIIEASGTFGATTDNKTIRVRLNGGIASSSLTVSAAGQTVWTLRLVVMKITTNTQWANSTAFSSTAVNTSVGGPNVTDTSAITITVTGQNITNSVLNSVTCRYLTVDFVK